MKKMEYVEFCEAIFKELREGKKWNLKDDKMEFFVEGCRGKGANEDRFIRRVNCQYYNSTSDVLQGDWLVVYKKSGAGVNTHEFPMKILYALYSHMEDMALVWLQFEASLNNWDRDNLNITSGLWDYEKKKENLGVRIYPCNKHELDGCVGFQHGDIAVLAVLCDYLEDETIVREKVLQEHIAFWFKQEFDVVWDGEMYLMVKTRPEKIKRGDVIGAVLEDETRATKRVIGLPGEHIIIGYSSIWIDHDWIEEDYLEYPGWNDFGTYDTELTLKKNEFYLMGDNRRGGTWCGIVTGEQILGRVIGR